MHGNAMRGTIDCMLVHHGGFGNLFCMRPDGAVVAITSEMNRVVTDGLSKGEPKRWGFVLFNPPIHAAFGAFMLETAGG